MSLKSFAPQSDQYYLDRAKRFIDTGQVSNSTVEDVAKVLKKRDQEGLLVNILHGDDSELRDRKRLHDEAILQGKRLISSRSKKPIITKEQILSVQLADYKRQHPEATHEDIVKTLLHLRENPTDEFWDPDSKLKSTLELGPQKYGEDVWETPNGAWTDEDGVDKYFTENKKNPRERKKLYDFEEGGYMDPKTGIRSDVYSVHKPTWTDRGKEFTQGLAKGVGNLADLASNYVAAPTTFLASKGAGLVGAKEASKKLKKVSDEYWNQNAAKEWSEADLLKTKNRDYTSTMLRGAGEFLPDILPANRIGKGAKIVSDLGQKYLPKAKPLVSRRKLHKLIKTPKLPLIAKLLDTPLTAHTAAGFAGAGAGHAYMTHDRFGDKNPEPQGILGVGSEIAGTMLGGALGGGLYNSAKKALRGPANSWKGYKHDFNADFRGKEYDPTIRPLTSFERKLAKQIHRQGKNTAGEKTLSQQPNHRNEQENFAGIDLSLIHI